jgi:hypothetical protein
MSIPVVWVCVKRWLYGLDVPVPLRFSSRGRAARSGVDPRKRPAPTPGLPACGRDDGCRYLITRLAKAGRMNYPSAHTRRSMRLNQVGLRSKRPRRGLSSAKRRDLTARGQGVRVPGYSYGPQAGTFPALIKRPRAALLTPAACLRRDGVRGLGLGPEDADDLVDGREDRVVLLGLGDLDDLVGDDVESPRRRR